MIHNDERFHEAVQDSVRRLEQRTAAELVVVSATRSGTYRDLSLLLGVSGAACLLLFAVFSPFHVDPAWLPAELLAAFGLFSWMGDSPLLLRWLSDEDRKRAQVAAAAAAAFHTEQVHATGRRVGVLVYVSALERRVELIPDHHVDELVPRAAWNTVRWHANDLDGFLSSLEQVGAILAEHLPAEAGQDNQLPDAPRVHE